MRAHSPGESLTEAFTLRGREFPSVRVKHEGRKDGLGGSNALGKK